MELVFVDGSSYPLGLEENGKLNLAPLKLDPLSIVVEGVLGLVDNTGVTKRTWALLRAELPQRLGTGELGTHAKPLQVLGDPVAGGHAVENLALFCLLSLFLTALQTETLTAAVSTAYTAASPCHTHHPPGSCWSLCVVRA